MPFPARLATQFIALAMLIVWTYLALHYVACAMHGTMHRHSGDPVHSFAIGTWVAGMYDILSFLASPAPYAQTARSRGAGDHARHPTGPRAPTAVQRLPVGLCPIGVALHADSVTVGTAPKRKLLFVQAAG
jgi:hypothetical protein